MDEYVRLREEFINQISSWGISSEVINIFYIYHDYIQLNDHNLPIFMPIIFYFSSKQLSKLMKIFLKLQHDVPCYTYIEAVIAFE